MSGRLSDRVSVRLPVLADLRIMALSVLFISTFAGAPPVLIAAGILGVGTGFAFIQSPATNAAANSLPEEEVGGGMGIFAGSSSSAVGRDRRSSGRSWRHEKSPAQPR
jgi:MFS transporter, DHA2 family, metal-tetracycline-proton antiporter